MPKKKFPYYPIYIDLEQRDVLIVGGGNVCARKAETMMRYGAQVTIVSPSVTEEIGRWADEGRLRHTAKLYDEGDLEGRSLVIASTDDQCINARVARDCRRRKIPVNVVDVTHLCEFIVPSIVEKGSIQIAVSTGGKSPAIARTLRELLDGMVGPEYAELNDLLGSLRAGAKKALATDTDRKRFFDGILASGVIGMLQRGERALGLETIAGNCRSAGVPVSSQLSDAIARSS